jgi:hypothetical protein
MSLDLFDSPKPHGNHMHVGSYKKHPILIGKEPTKDWIAMPGDDGDSICINDEIYHSLKKSPRFMSFLIKICEHEISVTEMQNSEEPVSDLDIEVITYLRQQGILEF